MEQIIEALKEKYHPTGIIVYGSYADGTSDVHSDFDALLILEDEESIHDTSVLAGVRMDVFGYPGEYLKNLDDPDEIVQICGGRIIMDRNGLAAQLLKKVEDYVAGHARSTPEAKFQLRKWCEKMLLRSDRMDAEGRYRGHWLLVDSLSIYCEVHDRYYFGPKKTLAYLEKADPEGYHLFCAALERREALAPWIDHIFKEIKQECEL